MKDKSPKKETKKLSKKDKKELELKNLRKQIKALKDNLTLDCKFKNLDKI